MLNAFIIIAIVLILFFPTLNYAQSTSTALASPTIVIEGVPEAPEPTSIILKLQQPSDNGVYAESSATISGPTIDAPPRHPTLHVILTTLQILWSGVVLIGRFLLLLFSPLHIVIAFLFNKLLFLFRPFIIIGLGIYNLTIAWPFQFMNYLSKTFYPLYVFLACASIIGLLVGGIASYTSRFLNSIILPNRPPKKVLPTPSPRPKTAESLVSSGAATPASFLRAPPPSKYPSGLGGIDDVHILDTNALFNSFSLPLPPSTPPGILYSAPTPAGSTAGGVIGETIFEEEDDETGDRTPVLSGTSHQETWGLAAGNPLSRPESAHGRFENMNEGIDPRSTWHPRAKREDVDARGIDWRDEGVRKRKVGAAS